MKVEISLQIKVSTVFFYIYLFVDNFLIFPENILNDRKLILTAYRHLKGYYMLGGYEITFIVRLYLYFLQLFLKRLFFFFLLCLFCILSF